MRRATVLAAGALALAATACGGGVDTDDPEAVVRALAEANYRCDAEAVEQINELTVESEREPIPAKTDNCTAGDPGSQLEGFDREESQPPEAAPELAMSTRLAGDFAVVHAEELNDNDEEDVTLVRTDDGWRWDPSGNPDQ